MAEPEVLAVKKDAEAIPATLDQPAAARFWLSVVGIGILTGFAAGLLTKLLEWVQGSLWGGNGREILDAAQHTAALRIVLILLAAGVVTGIAQVLLRKLSSGNDIDTTSAIWFHAGRLPALRTLASATLSVVLVGMGVSGQVSPAGYSLLRSRQALCLARFLAICGRSPSHVFPSDCADSLVLGQSYRQRRKVPFRLSFS